MHYCWPSGAPCGVSVLPLQRSTVQSLQWPGAGLVATNEPGWLMANTAQGLQQELHNSSHCKMVSAIKSGRCLTWGVCSFCLHPVNAVLDAIIHLCCGWEPHRGGVIFNLHSITFYCRAFAVFPWLGHLWLYCLATLTACCYIAPLMQVRTEDDINPNQWITPRLGPI